jgi:hypothetical protein
VRLAPADLDRIVTWIDLNAPYYPTYASYYHTHTFGRCPLSHQQLLALGRLVLEGAQGKDLGWTTVNEYAAGPLSKLMGRWKTSPVNFTRSEQSLCLKAFASGDPRHVAALATLREGQKMLAAHPEADAPGFQPCAEDQERLDYHAQRERIEARNRQAILEGRQVFDRAPGSAAVPAAGLR